MPVVIRPALTDVIALKESGWTAMFVLKKASAPVCIEKQSTLMERKEWNLVKHGESLTSEIARDYYQGTFS